MAKKRVAEKKTKKASKKTGKKRGTKKRMGKAERELYYNTIWLNYVPHALKEADTCYDAKINRAKEFIKAVKWHKKHHKH
jgi:hypothetical protein